MRLWETPVPIPNTTVKTQAADGTALETMWESRWAPDYGDVAQLGEHLPCKQGVESSNLFISIARVLNEDERKRRLNLVRGMSRHLMKASRRRSLNLVTGL